MQTVYQAIFAGHAVKYAFRYPATREHFLKWLETSEGEPDLIASPEEIARTHLVIPSANAEDVAEFKALCELTGRFLLRWDCCLFHAVSFLWRDRAWLLTAPSGTGKTTQFLNWRKLAPLEIMMISGDDPTLELRGEEIRVHASPWNGKESIGTRRSAPLGGVVVLEQGGENRITRLAPREALEALFKSLAFEPETEAEIRATCRILDGMLNRPVWKLVNRGDLASTELLRRTLAGGTMDEI